MIVIRIGTVSREFEDNKSVMSYLAEEASERGGVLEFQRLVYDHGELESMDYLTYDHGKISLTHSTLA